jgi:hypothetical protein
MVVCHLLRLREAWSLVVLHNCFVFGTCMQLASDKTLNCPYCVRPVSLDAYRRHVGECDMQQCGVLATRIQKFAGPFSGDLIDRYLEFIRYERAYYAMEWTEEFQEHNTAFYSVPIGTLEAKSLQKLAGASELRHVERVQNKELYLKYTDFREANADGRETLLFHGSRVELYNVICNQGFDVGHSKNGLFGYGLYFSSTMDYSKSFVKGRPCMLVCKVWLTPTTVISGNIHVVHDDFAAYPAYVVHH